MGKRPPVALGAAGGFPLSSMGHHQPGEPPEVSRANIRGHPKPALPKLEGSAGLTVADGPQNCDLKQENLNNLLMLRKYTACEEDSNLKSLDINFP